MTSLLVLKGCRPIPVKGLLVPPLNPLMHGLSLWPSSITQYNMLSLSRDKASAESARLCLLFIARSDGLSDETKG